jgi:glycosyltransferase involved in cell wall biosynthesis
VHAHCASGSGFVAWLSGRPYIVTTYGTEVFGARERGRLYRWMIARVVRNAALLTATTPRMAQVLHEEFGVPLARIRTFSLGIDTDQFHPVAPATRATLRREEGLPADEPCWVINRRSLPLYRTGEVISGFQRYCDTHPHGRLVVLSGDQDPVYSRQLRELVAASPHSGRVQFVDEFLAPPQVARWLQRADFAISVPRTDQLSTSILEALGCGAVPILADLPAYAPLHACPGIVRASDCTPAGFQDVFTSTAGWESRLLEARRAACVTFVQEHYSERVFLPDVAALYHTIGSAGPEGRRRAA